MSINDFRPRHPSHGADELLAGDTRRSQAAKERKNARSRGQCSLKVGILGAEHLDQAMRVGEEEIERCV